MGKFYLTSVILFFSGMGVLWQAAELPDPPRGASAGPSSPARYWPPILVYTGGLVMLAGTLCFVTAFSTHTRLAANLPAKDLVEL